MANLEYAVVVEPLSQDDGGASIGTVRKWESGERSPSGAAERLLRLLDAEPKIVTRALGIKPSAPKRQPRSQMVAG